MTAKTRYFVIASLLILTVGLGTGLLAYYVGIPSAGLIGRDGPEELRYVPRNAAVVGFADVREIMTSDVRERIRRAMPAQEDGQREFQDRTGINVEMDIDRVVASLVPLADGGTSPLVLARGRFSDVKIEALMRGHGATAEEYNGKRLIEQQRASTGADAVEPAQPAGNNSMALSFLEPGLIAVGSPEVVRAAIDLAKSGESVTANSELMDLMRSLEPGNGWAIGRLDNLIGGGRLPERLTTRLPPISLFSVSGRIDTDIRGVVRAETADDQAANDLRDVIRGFLALAKLQSGNRPEFQRLIESLELGGTGKSVALSFSIPGEALDFIAASRAGAATPR
jgi:hypothetical protein